MSLPGAGLIAGLIGGGLAHDNTAYGIAQALGLGTGLVYCWDAGDPACVSVGTTQTITDRAGGANLNRGTSSGAEGSDAQFNGSAGGKSKNEFYSTDGGDQLSGAGGVPSFINPFHRNNAAMTLIIWGHGWNFVSGNPYDQMIFSSTPGSGTGIRLTPFYVAPDKFIPEQHLLSFRAYNGGSVVAEVQMPMPAGDASQGRICAFSFDEAVTNDFDYVVNANVGEDQACAYTSPSAGNAGEFCHLRNMSSGAAVAGCLMWNVKRSVADMQAFIAALREARGYIFSGVGG